MQAGPDEAGGGAGGIAMPIVGMRRPLAYVVLLSSTPLLAVMFAALGSVLPMIATHFNDNGNGTWVAQFTVTMAAVGVIVGGLSGGFLIERVGLRPVLLLSLLFYAVAGSAGLYLDGAAALLASRFVLGLSVALVGVSVVTLVGAWFSGVARARMLGFQAATGSLGGVSALLLGGWLAEGGDWRAPFAIYLASLVVLLLAALSIPATAAPKRPPLQPGDGALLLRQWPVYLLALALFTGYFMTSLQLTFLLAEDGITSPFVRSVTIAIGVSAGSVAGLTFGFVFARLGAERQRMLLIGLMSAGFLLIGFGHDLAVIGAGAMLAGAGGAMIAPHIEGLLLIRVPLSLRARALGFVFTALYAADFVNPLLVTPARGAIGMHGVFITAGVLMALGLLAAWLVRAAAPAAKPETV